MLIYFWFRASCLSILHRIERGGLYASGMVYLIYLGYLVPFPIWKIVSIFHCMEGPLGWCMLIFSLMRNLYIINAYTYIHFIYFIIHKQNHLLAFCSTDKYSIAQNQWLSTYCSMPTFPLLLRIPYLSWIMVAVDTLKMAWIWKKRIYVEKMTLYCILTRTTTGNVNSECQFLLPI